MTIKQLSVFLENREGRLDEVLTTLGANGVNIVALSLADTADYGMLRMIVSDPQKGKVVLKEAGCTLKNVVKTTVFLADINDFAKINAIYAKYFDEHKPARSCVQAGALPKGGLFEMEVIAVKE
jgi:hypothetical protein